MAYYENISLEKGMYSVPGKSFSQVLEELDRPLWSAGGI